MTAQSTNRVLNKRRNTPLRNQAAASDSERESSGLSHEMNKRSQFDPTVLVVCALRSTAGRSESASGVASEVAPSPLSTGTGQSVNDAEIHKIWHYQDPTGKTQGPFTMVQLRRWNGCGHFPADLQIWRIDERQEDSILLIEALNGNYNKQEPRISSDKRIINLNGSGEASPTQRDINIAEDSPNCKERLCSPPKLNSEDTNKVVQGLTSSEGRIITVAEVWDSLNDDAPLSLTQPPQLCCSTQLPSNQDRTSLQGNESQECRQDNGNLRLLGFTEVVPPPNNGHNGIEKRSNGDTHPGHLSGQNCDAVSGPNTFSLEKSVETSQENKGINLSIAPSAAVRSHNEKVDENAERDRQSMPSNLPAQDPAPTWSSTPSLVAEVTIAKGVTERWGDGYSSVPSKPVDEWDSTIGSGTSLRSTDIPGNNSSPTLSAHPTIMGSSQTHQPLPLESSWQAIVNDTNDFASLGEESVSDLLAEVEAMENAGLPSPTSAMKCNHDLNDDSKNDCFSPIEGFDPTTGLVKSEVFTSTVDLIVTSQPTITAGEPCSADSNGDLADARRTSHKHSTSSAEPQRGVKQQGEGNAGNHWKSGPGSELPRISPPQTTWQLPGISPRAWEAVQGSSHWDGTNHGHTNMDWEARQGQYQRTGSFGAASGSGSPGIWSDQQRYSGGSNRYTSPRERGFQGTDQGYGRNSRGAWSSSSRQYSGGGGYRRQPPKGQRVCKYYENGYCRRGASCSFFHP